LSKEPFDSPDVNKDFRMFADRIALSDDFSYKLGFFIIPTHEHKLASIYLKA